MYVRKVAEGVYEAREGDLVLGRGRVSGTPPDGELTVEAEAMEVVAALRAHLVEQARRDGFARLRDVDGWVEVPGPHLAGDDLTRKTLRDFFDGERLKEMPASLERRRVVLEWLAGRFEPGVTYAESEVNQVLLRHHPDFAMARRYLVDWGLLEREGGRYWRASQSFR